MAEETTIIPSQVAVDDITIGLNESGQISFKDTVQSLKLIKQFVVETASANVTLSDLGLVLGKKYKLILKNLIAGGGSSFIRITSPAGISNGHSIQSISGVWSSESSNFLRITNSYDAYGEYDIRFMDGFNKYFVMSGVGFGEGSMRYGFCSKVDLSSISSLTFNCSTGGVTFDVGSTFQVYEVVEN